MTGGEGANKGDSGAFEGESEACITLSTSLRLCDCCAIVARNSGTNEAGGITILISFFLKGW